MITDYLPNNILSIKYLAHSSPSGESILASSNALSDQHYHFTSFKSYDFFKFVKNIATHCHFVDNKTFIMLYIEGFLTTLVEHEMGIFFPHFMLYQCSNKSLQNGNG